MNLNALALIVGGACLIVITAAVAVLAWHGTINGQAVIGFYTGLTVSGLVGGVSHVSGALGASSAQRK